MSQSPTKIELRAGSTLGRYELLLPVAKGGMAQVWAARLRGTRGFQKVVAIKTVLSDVMDNTRMERMFLEEAQLAAQIHHPNVVGTLELGEHEGTLYLVMEWVEGEPLNQVMARAAAKGGLPLPIAVNLIGQACQGLYAAHELRDDSGALLGLVHRDVSPQNLLISFSGTAKLVDFGIAKATARSSGLTEAGEVKGKFAFMAPEQVRGHAVDCRTDLFALGILLYSITTGRHPFRGAHPAETLQNICSERAPATPSSFLSDYPSELEEVVMKALEKAPAARFSSANELLSALEQAMPGPLEASFDVQVSSYLRELFGAHATERRAAIRTAQGQIDRQRSESSASSVGTLRAISIDQQDSGDFAITPSAGSAAAASGEPLQAELPPKSRTRKLAAVVAVLGLSVSGLAFELSRTPAPSASSAAAVPLPSEQTSQPAAVALPSVVPPPPPSEVAEQPAPEATEKRERRHERAPRFVPPAAMPPASAATAAPPAASIAAPPRASATPPAQSANAWDRGAFGGRH